MKKILSIIAIMTFFLGMSQNQTLTGTKTFTNPPKFLNLSLNSTNTKFLTVDSTGLLQWTSLTSTLPTFQQVTTTGNTTNNSVFSTGINGFTSTDSGTNNSLSMRGDGLYFIPDGSEYVARIIQGNTLSSLVTLTLPGTDGTLALNSYVDAKVGDFINDGATTIAPSQNAVFDALALKATDSNTLHKTGNETLQGLKTFSATNTGSPHASAFLKLDEGIGNSGGSFSLGNASAGGYDSFSFNSRSDVDGDGFGSVIAIFNAEEGISMSKNTLDFSQTSSIGLNNGIISMYTHEGSNTNSSEFNAYAFASTVNDGINSNSFEVRPNGIYSIQPLKLWDSPNGDYGSVSISDNQFLVNRWDNTGLFYFSNNSGFQSNFNSDGITGNRNYTLPDFDGALASESNLRGINGVNLYDPSNDDYARVSSDDNEVNIDGATIGRLATFANGNFQLKYYTNSATANISLANIATGNRTYYLPDTDGELATVKYKVYTALLSQSGTNDPTAVVLDNTIGDIVWTRDTTGHYIGTLTGAFVANKTWTVCNSSFPEAMIAINRGSANLINVQTKGTSTHEDDILGNTPIEIRVYN